MTAIGPLQAVIYGVVQGLTEFLPISSTAHLRLVQAWMDPNVNQAGFTAFTAVIQLGTMAAVVLYFWRELVHIAVAWLRGVLSYVRGGSSEERLSLE
jgi:undecaprenyl-diphosphatase